MKKFRYNINRVLLYQTELTYGEDVKVKSLIDAAHSSILPGSVSDIINTLHEKNVWQNIYPMILRLYEPTIFHRWWNRYWFGKYNFSLTLLLENAPASMVGRVTGDFFLCNPTWMQKFIGIALLSGGLNQKVLGELATISTKGFTRSVPVI